ncbi:MAG: hypothetical protein ACOYNS_01000 [Bacteroidota bacterium]
MNQTEQSSTDHFTAFTPTPIAKDTPRRSQGNIVKDVNYKRLELDQLHTATPRSHSNSHSHSGEPKVIINRSGELIESIEFVCSCGQKKTVSFNYEGE